MNKLTKLSQVWRRAREILNSRGAMFICWILEELEDEGEISAAMLEKAKEVIYRDLQGHGTLEAWVDARLGTFHRLQTLSETGRHTRLLWLEDLEKRALREEAKK